MGIELVRMRQPDGKTIMHGRVPYDPQKAHEYYLRTRQLKGRKKGSTYTVKTEGGGTVHLTEKQLVEQKAYAEKRVSEIKTRLNELSSHLRKMMADARHSQAKSQRKPTVADKSKAARESKQYRAKHKQQLATKRKVASSRSPAKHTPKKNTVAELEHKITLIKSNLQKAVAKQRALASATRN